MARSEIPIEFIGGYIEEQLERLVQATVLETDRQLKKGSPVDTGRFRASWHIGENTSTGEPHPPVKKGQKIPSPPPQYTNYAGGSEQLGKSYHLHNNLPYAERLADGWSKEADAGWVELIAKNMTQYIGQTYNQIKRDS
jgi:hypothetical protein|tara:strand:+ start:160 stop:576 length:417 start_codon:yes stop_codon:yes gene_type:complete